MSLFPLVSFDRIDHALCDRRLVAWGHFLGACTRPFGRQSFGLFVRDELVAVAVSCSTINGRCGGLDRRQCVELARLCTHPDHRAFTRVAIRLWREVAPDCWARKHWPVEAVVSYSNALRHSGDIYRFDGWTKVADVGGSQGGGTWTRRKTSEPKAVWVYRLPRIATGKAAA